MPARSPSRSAAFWSIAVLLVVVLSAAGAPSPLYRVYQERFDFSAGMLTAVFGIYAFALLATLLTLGALSDHVGRRPVLAAGLLLQAAAMVLFIAADGVGWLLTARVVQGLSTGVLTGALGATLLDLQHPERPMASVVNSAGPGLGLALGAVGAGLAIQFTATPTGWVYGVLTGVFLATAALVWRLPESSPRLPGARASLRPTVRVPPAQRSAFLVAVPCLVAGWALLGLYLSLAPSVLAEVFGIADHLAGSLLILAINIGAAVGSVAARRLAGETAMLTGALVFAVGVTITLLALATGSGALFFGSAVLSGLGAGAAFFGALTTATAGVSPGGRAGLMSSIFVVGYLSFSVPAIAAGVAAARVGLGSIATVYAISVIVLALVAVAGLLVRRRTAADQVPPTSRPEQLAA